MSTVLRLREVCNTVRLSPSTIRELEARGEFPARRQLGRRAVGWLLDEIEAWLQSRSRRTLAAK